MAAGFACLGIDAPAVARGMVLLAATRPGVAGSQPDRIPIGGIGSPVTGYIKPGKRKLSGFETLWFARSREGADDYSRMARQKCVMNAMLQQLSPRTVVTKLQARLLELDERSAGHDRQIAQVARQPDFI